MPKQKKKQVRISGARVLTNDECIKHLREKETEKQKKEQKLKEKKERKKFEKTRPATKATGTESNKALGSKKTTKSKKGKGKAIEYLPFVWGVLL